MTEATKSKVLEMLTAYARDERANRGTNIESYYRGAVVGAMCICLELQIPRDEIEDALQRAQGE